jgi:hypothetical protein
VSLNHRSPRTYSARVTTVLALVCASLTGCGARLTPSNTDAGALDVEPSDSALNPLPFRLTVRVVLGPFVPAERGSNFSVVATNRAGRTLRSTTDSEGVASIDTPADSVGPWDVTVARVGFLAVSILDVTANLDARVYTEALTERRQSVAPRALTARFRNAADTSVASLFSRALANSEYASAPDWTLEQHDDRRPGVPGARFYAIEWLSDGSGFPLRPLRAAQLDTVSASQPGPIAFDVDFSRSTLMATESTVQVELPSEGLVTRETVRRGAPSRVQFPFVYEHGASFGSYPVGTVSADYPRSAMGPIITIAHFTGELLPDSAGITYGSDTANPLEIQLWPRDLARLGRLTVPPVRQLSTTGSTIDTVEVTADAAEYTPGFAVLGADGQSVGWVGYAHNNQPITRRKLPTLPEGFSLRAHFNGATARVIATLTHRGDSAQSPWEPDAMRTMNIEVDSPFVTLALP